MSRISPPATYAFLLAALPRHGDPLRAKRPPLSRLSLERRLALLPDEDRATLAALERLARWEEAQALDADAAFLAEAKATIESLKSPRLRQALDRRLILRTAMAGLRRRAAGEDPPAPGWGWNPAAKRIRANWREPSFGLGAPFAWLTQADALLRAGKSYALEQLLVLRVDQELRRAVRALDASFESVAIYVLRWALVERWTRFDADAAKARFALWVETLAEGAA